jgi:flavin reductase (DIM6/NTAB) family NADH-FMN oxidoreductase RutF
MTGPVIPVGRTSPGPPTPPDARRQQELRAVLGTFATGVVVVTAVDDEPCGMTANAFTSVSLKPPLVLVCVNRRAEIHRAMLARRSFVVSVLGAHQEPLARHFADHARLRGKQGFGLVSWTPAPRTGNPIVRGALAWIECGLSEAYEGGDHSIFIGEVLDGSRGTAGDALLFFGGSYHRLESCPPQRNGAALPDAERPVP